MFRHGTDAASRRNYFHPRRTGEVKVFPTTDDAKRFKTLKKVILDGREPLELSIEQVKFFKNMVILKFKDMTISMMWKHGDRETF